jgi:tetratricopeptide (TPR) repeat protein
MNNDSNSKRPSDSSADPLARALEELMENRLSQGPATEWTSTSVLDGVQCPQPEAWLPLLGGDVNPADDANLDVLLAHAAECGKCAAHLRMLTAEPSEEEATELAGLVSASPEWQGRLAAELARTPRQTLRLMEFSRPRKASRIYLWSGSAIAATLLIGAVTFFWWQRANSPEKMLAEAYSQSRTYDLRMPGAGFSAVTNETHLRGGGAGHESTGHEETGHESSRLLDARARIERQLENAPEDPHWLELEARADIQEEKFDPAIEILDRLLTKEPVTAGLLVDDASAYFERGSLTGSEDDRAKALENLRHADEMAPDDPLVLFNEAVVLEDRGQVMNAVETWNRYLKFERDPRWLAEGRARLEALEQKLIQLKTHQGRMGQRPAAPQGVHAPAA